MQVVCAGGASPAPVAFLGRILRSGTIGAFVLADVVPGSALAARPLDAILADPAVRRRDGGREARTLRGGLLVD